MSVPELKILTVNVSDSLGGAARAAYRIHNAVRDAGVEGLFLVKNKSLTDPKVLAVDSFDTHSTSKAPFRWLQNKVENKLQHWRWRAYPNRADYFMSDLRGSDLHGALQKIDFDILHLHWINLRFIDIEDLSKIKNPIVWTLHDCWAFTGVCHYFYDCKRYRQSCGACPHLMSNLQDDLSHKVWRKKMEVFSSLNFHIVCPSNWLANAAKESSIFNKFPVSVIPNPIDIDFFIPGDRLDACKQLNIDSSKIRILYGAMNATKDFRKGFDEFRRSMQYFERNFETKDVEILIFGSEEKAALDLNKIPQIDLGMLNDKKLLAAYRAADVMVVPSLSENLSNIIMESMACGTPVVAFNIGGNSDMIVHKDNGYLAKEKDVEDMAEGVNFCISNKNLREAARMTVVENFNTKVVGNRYLELYNQIL